MDKNHKLVWVGAAALAAGIALPWLLQTSRPASALPPPASTFAPSSTREHWAELAGQTPIPEPLQQPLQYLEQRWGHMPEPGLTLAGIEPDGEIYFIDPKAQVAHNPQGEPMYATRILKPHKFQGPLVHYGEEPPASGGRIYLPDELQPGTRPGVGK